jgi:hypothetical protein
MLYHDMSYDAILAAKIRSCQIRKWEGSFCYLTRAATLPATMPGSCRKREREAFYKTEMIRKITETEGAGANAALAFIREQERNAYRSRAMGLRLGGRSHPQLV